MVKKLKACLDLDLQKPLGLNFLLYSYTFILSIIFSVLYYIAVLESQPFNMTEFLKVLTDCVVPTTATLVLCSLVQNIVLASQLGLTHYTLTFWALIADVSYMTLYPALRRYLGLYSFIFVLVFSVVLVVLGLCAVIQVDNQQHSQGMSISG